MFMENKSVVLAEYDSNHNLYQMFASEVKHLLQGILREEGIECNAITCRLKDKGSLSEKIDRKQDKYKCLGDLTDIAGVRVITYYIEDVDKVAEIVEQNFTIDRQNSIDKREALEPDRFGYCSVHYVVEMNQERLKLREYQTFSGLKCEIQIRSVLQHAWAEIEHDLGYKSDIGIPKSIRRNFSRLAGLLEIADKEFQEIRAFLQSYQEEAVEKIKHNELLDTEIDAILLETCIRTDKDIVELNNIIAEISGYELQSNLTIGQLQSSINQLHWLQIDTMGQLRDFISRNKKCAIDIARVFLQNIEEDEITIINRTIAFFYLCYAELICKNYDLDEIIGFFSDNNIESTYNKRRQAAEELIQLREELNISNK